MAFASIEPFGEVRGDVRAGIVASVIANVNRDSKKRRQPYEPSDFMPHFGEPEPQEDKLVRDLKAAFSQFPRAEKGSD